MRFVPGGDGPFGAVATYRVTGPVAPAPLAAGPRPRPPRSPLQPLGAARGVPVDVDAVLQGADPLGSVWGSLLALQTAGGGGAGGNDRPALGPQACTAAMPEDPLAVALQLPQQQQGQAGAEAEPADGPPEDDEGGEDEEEEGREERVEDERDRARREMSDPDEPSALAGAHEGAEGEPSEVGDGNDDDSCSDEDEEGEGAARDVPDGYSPVGPRPAHGRSWAGPHTQQAQAASGPAGGACTGGPQASQRAAGHGSRDSRNAALAASTRANDHAARPQLPLGRAGSSRIPAAPAIPGPAGAAATAVAAPHTHTHSLHLPGAPHNNQQPAPRQQQSAGRTWSGIPATSAGRPRAADGPSGEVDGRPPPPPALVVASALPAPQSYSVKRIAPWKQPPPAPPPAPLPAPPPKQKASRAAAPVAVGLHEFGQDLPVPPRAAGPPSGHGPVEPAAGELAAGDTAEAARSASRIPATVDGTGGSDLAAAGHQQEDEEEEEVQSPREAQPAGNRPGQLGELAPEAEEVAAPLPAAEEGVAVQPVPSSQAKARRGRGAQAAAGSGGLDDGGSTAAGDGAGGAAEAAPAARGVSTRVSPRTSKKAPAEGLSTPSGRSRRQLKPAAEEDEQRPVLAASRPPAPAAPPMPTPRTSPRLSGGKPQAQQQPPAAQGGKRAREEGYAALHARQAAAQQGRQQKQHKAARAPASASPPLPSPPPQQHSDAPRSSKRRRGAAGQRPGDTVAVWEAGPSPGLAAAAADPGAPGTHDASPAAPTPSQQPGAAAAHDAADAIAAPGGTPGDLPSTAGGGAGRQQAASGSSPASSGQQEAGAGASRQGAEAAARRAPQQLQLQAEPALLPAAAEAGAAAAPRLEREGQQAGASRGHAMAEGLVPLPPLEQQPGQQQQPDEELGNELGNAAGAQAAVPMWPEPEPQQAGEPSSSPEQAPRPAGRAGATPYSRHRGAQCTPSGKQPATSPARKLKFAQELAQVGVVVAALACVHMACWTACL